MERFRDFMKVTTTLTMEEFVEQFPHAFFFFSEKAGVLEGLAHTRLVVSTEGKSTMDRFTEEVLDFIPLLPNPHPNREFPKKAFIGRDSGRDYVISHNTVSSRHACLLYDEAQDAYQLVDSGSTNGTRLCGRDLKAGEPAVVHDGDVVTFGQIHVLFLSPKGAYRFMRQYRAFRDAMRR